MPVRSVFCHEDFCDEELQVQAQYWDVLWVAILVTPISNHSDIFGDSCQIDLFSPNFFVEKRKVTWNEKEYSPQLVIWVGFRNTNSILIIFQFPMGHMAEI